MWHLWHEDAAVQRIFLLHESYYSGTQRRVIGCPWQKASRRIINILPVIKYQCLLFLYRFVSPTARGLFLFPSLSCFFPIYIAHASCTCVQTHRSNTISIHPQNNFSCPFSYIKIVSKVKRLFIGAATSLDTRWCHKSRKAWKSKTSIWTKRGKQ